MRSATIAIAALAVATCTQPALKREPPPLMGPNMYCQMAVAALEETVKPYDAQPYGLEEACVRNRAMFSGRIFVDARFGHKWERVPARQCTEGPYVIRFDFENYEKSPAPEVVLVLFESETPIGRSFSAVMEEPNWPSKKPGLVALSACGSAFGNVRKAGAVWTATVEPPPRAPDEL